MCVVKKSRAGSMSVINRLNAELNPICHLLVLLGDVTFMGPCIVSIFRYISNKMQRYTVYLYMETALHVSGGISTHHRERTPPTAHPNRFQLFHDSGVTNTRCCRYSCMRT
jgi:hypothetical protein